MLELTPNDPIILAYVKDLHRLKQQGITHELGLKAPFQTLLDKAARKRGWTLVPELSTYSGGKRVVPDFAAVLVEDGDLGVLEDGNDREYGGSVPPSFR